MSGENMPRGGLDRFLGPEAKDASSLPEHTDEADPREVDCEGDDRDEAVCEIARLEQEQREIGAEGT